MLTELILYVSVMAIGGEYSGAYATPELADCEKAVAEARADFPAQFPGETVQISDCKMVTFPLPEGAAAPAPPTPK